MKLTVHLAAFLIVGIVTLGLKPGYVLAFSGWIIVFEEKVFQEKQQAKKSKDGEQYGDEIPLPSNFITNR